MVKNPFKRAPPKISDQDEQSNKLKKCKRVLSRDLENVALEDISNPIPTQNTVLAHLDGEELHIPAVRVQEALFDDDKLSIDGIDLEPESTAETEGKHY